MTTAIAQILAAVFGLVACYYLNKAAVKWLQWYRDKRQKSEMEAARQQSQEENQKANRDSDALRKIDGR